MNIKIEFKYIQSNIFYLLYQLFIFLNLFMEYLFRLVKNNMHPTHIYFCHEFLWAVYLQIKHVKKDLKNKFEIASTEFVIFNP